MSPKLPNRCVCRRSGEALTESTLGSDGDGVLVHMWAPQSASATVAMSNVTVTMSDSVVQHQNGGYNGIGCVIGGHYTNGTVSHLHITITNSTFDSNFGNSTDLSTSDALVRVAIPAVPPAALPFDSSLVRTLSFPH